MPLRLRILAAPRFAGPAGVPGAEGMAPGPSEERVFEIAPDLSEVRIGRQRDVEIELPFPAVSSLHARLVRGDLPTNWCVEDLGSMNGSWLDGKRIPSRCAVAIRPSQRLRIATVDIVFEGWSATSDGAEGTATIARRLISDIFGVMAGEVAMLVVESGSARQTDLRLALADRRYLAGRAESCDLILNSEHVSREHAAFVRRWDGVVVSDLGSKNGVMVNGQRIPGERRLADGDRITIGIVTVRLTDPEDRYLRRLESLGSGANAIPSAKSPEGASAETPASSSSSSFDVPGAALDPPGPDASNPAVAAKTPKPETSAPDAPVPPPSTRRPSPLRWLLTTLISLVALVAVAGLIALWLATH